MALTLLQAKELSQNKLTEFVIDEFRKSPLLDMLTFDDTVKAGGQGQSLTYSYNRVTTLPTASTRALNAEYIAQEAVTTAYNVDLKVFGGSFDLDRVIIKDEKQVKDHIKFQTAQKIEATRALFHDMFINGDSGTTATEFDGLEKALLGSTTDYDAESIDLSTAANIATNAKAFTFALRKFRALLNGAPSLYLMNDSMYATFQSIMDNLGIALPTKEQYGNETAQWGSSTIMAIGDKDGTSEPIIETDGSGLTSIYAVRLGLDGVHAVSPSGSNVADIYLPNLTLPGAVKTGEVEMVAAIALKATRAAGVIRNIKIG